MEKSKISRTDFLVYLYFIIITFCKGIGLEGSNYIYIFALIFGCGLIFLKILSTSITKKELIYLFIIVLIGLIDLIFGGITTILFTAISLCCLRDSKVKDILKIMFWTRVISFGLMIVLSFTGLIENNAILHYRTGIGISNRYSFGYSHPNFAHSSFAIIVFLGGYLYGERLKLPMLIFIGVINYFLYTLTISRTGFFMVSLYLVILYFHNKYDFVKKFEIKSLKYLIYIILFFSFITAYFYTDFDFIQQLDVLLTGRIRYLNILVSNYSIPLFGSDIYNNYVLFDNGYFSLLYEGGLFAAIYYFVNLNKSNNYIIKNKMYDEALFVIIFMLYCIFESYYPNILMNPALLFFTYSIFGNTKNIGDKNE